MFLSDQSPKIYKPTLLHCLDLSPSVYIFHISNASSLNDCTTLSLLFFGPKHYLQLMFVSILLCLICLDMTLDHVSILTNVWALFIAQVCWPYYSLISWYKGIWECFNIPRILFLKHKLTFVFTFPVILGFLGIPCHYHMLDTLLGF